MIFEQFEKRLLGSSLEAEEELGDALLAHGDAQIARWLIEILATWTVRTQTLSRKDQNAVLWRMIGSPLFIGLMLADGSTLSQAERREIVRSATRVTLAVPSLYGIGEPMDNGYFMLWHTLASGVDDPEISLLLLQTLSELIAHPDDRVQASAIHGLGHLRHPGRRAVIDWYLKSHPQRATDPWIQQCRDGTVM